MMMMMMVVCGGSGGGGGEGVLLLFDLVVRRHVKLIQLSVKHSSAITVLGGSQRVTRCLEEGREVRVCWY